MSHHLPRPNAFTTHPRWTLGKALFFDSRLSQSGQLSCASCHQPHYQYSEPSPLPEGFTKGRRTQSLVNSAKNRSFFWDGRASTLAQSCLGPLEHPLEHGLSRSEISRRVLTYHGPLYQIAFGPLPKLSFQGPSTAPHQAPEISSRVATYALASLKDLWTMNAVLEQAQKLAISPAQAMATELLTFYPTPPSRSQERWKSLSNQEQQNISQVFTNTGIALASFVESLQTEQSSFDRFLERWSTGERPEQALDQDDGFGKEELLGLQLFVGPAGCKTCHMGRYFTDHQFHNLGLPRRIGADPGRAVGALIAREQGPHAPGSMDEETQEELKWLDTENVETLGAFRTPGLRNVANRPPYSHDGRFKTLEQQLDYYNRLSEGESLGHREETLRALYLSSHEVRALQRFLESISSAPLGDLPSPLKGRGFQRKIRGQNL